MSDRIALQLSAEPCAKLADLGWDVMILMRGRGYERPEEDVVAIVGNAAVLRRFDAKRKRRLLLRVCRCFRCCMRIWDPNVNLSRIGSRSFSTFAGSHIGSGGRAAARLRLGQPGKETVWEDSPCEVLPTRTDFWRHWWRYQLPLQTSLPLPWRCAHTLYARPTIPSTWQCTRWEQDGPAVRRWPSARRSSPRRAPLPLAP